MLISKYTIPSFGRNVLKKADFPSPWEGLGEGLRRVSVFVFEGSVNVDVKRLFSRSSQPMLTLPPKKRFLVRLKPSSLPSPKGRGRILFCWPQLEPPSPFSHHVNHQWLVFNAAFPKTFPATSLSTTRALTAIHVVNSHLPYFAITATSAAFIVNLKLTKTLVSR